MLRGRRRVACSPAADGRVTLGIVGFYRDLASAGLLVRSDRGRCTPQDGAKPIYVGGPCLPSGGRGERVAFSAVRRRDGDRVESVEAVELLSKDELIEMLRERAEKGVKLSFPGKAVARRP